MQVERNALVVQAFGSDGVGFAVGVADGATMRSHGCHGGGDVVDSEAEYRSVDPAACGLLAVPHADHRDDLVHLRPMDGATRAEAPTEDSTVERPASGEVG